MTHDVSDSRHSQRVFFVLLGRSEQIDHSIPQRTAFQVTQCSRCPAVAQARTADIAVNAITNDRLQHVPIETLCGCCDLHAACAVVQVDQAARNGRQILVVRRTDRRIFRPCHRHAKQVVSFKALDALHAIQLLQRFDHLAEA